MLRMRFPMKGIRLNAGERGRLMKLGQAIGPVDRASAVGCGKPTRRRSEGRDLRIGGAGCFCRVFRISDDVEIGG